MKATLTFNLPEEEEDHRSALDGALWKAVVEDMAKWLRDDIKYNGNVVMESARKNLFEIIEDRGLKLD